MMMNEIVIEIPPPKPLPGWPCPRCGGQGNMGDGWSSVSYREDGSGTIRSVPSTPCHLCNGKGRVNVTPIE